MSYRWPGACIEANLTTPGCWRLHELFARMSADGVDTVVMEASSHALHQKRVAGLEFDAAVLTNLTAITQWPPLVQINGLPVKVNEYGFDTGTIGNGGTLPNNAWWVVLVPKGP